MTKRRHKCIYTTREFTRVIVYLLLGNYFNADERGDVAFEMRAVRASMRIGTFGVARVVVGTCGYLHSNVGKSYERD